MTVREERTQAAEDLKTFAQDLIASEGLSRDALSRILEKLKAIAARTDFWVNDDYAEPNETDRQARYRIAGNDDDTFVLYLNVMLPGKKIPPHDHTTWACVAAVDGVEENRVYRRLDDGGEAGKAQLEVDRIVQVAPGTGVALMPDDIHSVSIDGAKTIRHLHFYGRALETLKERTVFDLENGTCRPMAIGVKTRQG
ncbi:cysteine dioxygenase family protein [Aquamicrobium terrae]|uniref:Metal-dependent enzyme (Double-stranded beta helix superfamily) n=1 Tax=Aquamicrobium terrae TaxID=1324945 RepID=A0ABV2N4E4_9HYPH